MNAATDTSRNPSRNGPAIVKLEHGGSHMRLASNGKAPPPFVDAFCSGMPSSYWLHHGHDDIREHAEIAWRRRDQLVHVELVPARHGTDPCINVVTDDRPGLLSLLAAAISAHALDIISAKIYCRATGGTLAEAVDFFLVRRLDDVGGPGPPHELELGSLRRLMASLLRGETDIESFAKRPSPASQPKGRRHTDVHFEERYGEVDRLIVDTDDRPGLLLAITTALFLARVTVSGAEVLTVGGRAHDEFDVREWDGSHVTRERKAIIVESVASAVATVG
jgi:[protein-PII] uridylyltransferase